MKYVVFLPAVRTQNTEIKTRTSSSRRPPWCRRRTLTGHNESRQNRQALAKSYENKKTGRITLCKQEETKRRSGNMWGCCVHAFRGCYNKILSNDQQFLWELPFTLHWIVTVFGIRDICLLCQYRGIRHSISEKNGDHFKRCCHNSKVNLPYLCTPVLLEKLANPSSKLAQHYPSKIHSYKKAIVFSWRTPRNPGLYCFQIHGAVYCSIGALYLQENERLFCSGYYRSTQQGDVKTWKWGPKATFLAGPKQTPY